MYEAIKSTYAQVREDQAQIKGEMYAMTAKIESRVHEISKELEQGRRMPTTSRAFESFPDVSDIGIASPPKTGLGEMPTRMNIGKPQTTAHYLTSQSYGQRRMKVFDTRQHPQ